MSAEIKTGSTVELKFAWKGKRGLVVEILRDCAGSSFSSPC
jgi:hypothetical protein